MANAALQFISASAKQRHANVTRFGLPSQHASQESWNPPGEHFSASSRCLAKKARCHTSYQHSWWRRHPACAPHPAVCRKDSRFTVPKGSLLLRLPLLGTQHQSPLGGDPSMVWGVEMMSESPSQNHLQHRNRTSLSHLSHHLHGLTTKSRAPRGVDFQSHVR